jgi:thiol-disulfide isomerase/thioredoxin
MGRLTTTSSALAELDSASAWLNSEPLTADGLRGRVVAVQFCTYSCVNWIRTLPYVRAWASAYRDRGLVVVGAHAPEFAFERELAGVRRSIEEMEVEHPIVLDNDYAIWRAFGNRYWPALYLLDGEGRLQFEHFGEGAYTETETAIRELLNAEGEPVHVAAGGIEAAADWETLRSPETYLGYARAERRVGEADGVEGLVLNQWTLTGEWTIEAEPAVLDAAPGSVAYRFQARDLNLVLAPPSSGEEVRFTVLLDGQPPGEAHGIDVDERGRGSVTEPRLYQLVRQPGAVGERTFEIEFQDPGVHAYVFTFG